MRQTILDKKARRLRKTLEAEGLASHHITDTKSEHGKTLAVLFKRALTRPFIFLFTEPITWTTSIYNGYLFGIVCSSCITFPCAFSLHAYTSASRHISRLVSARFRHVTEWSRL